MDNSDLNNIMADIVHVLNRTFWVIEIKKHPTKFQSLVAKLFFKKKFIKIIKDN